MQNVTRAYFETNAVIYFLENEGEAQTKIADLIYKLIEQNAKLFISEIGIAECFYGAFKSKNQALEDKYSQLFFEENLFYIIPIDFDLLLAASKTGVESGLKLIDAIHFQSAIESQCEAFITNDARFRSSSTLKIYRLSDL